MLTGKEGAVQFVIYTNWHLPHVQKRFDELPLNDFPYMFHKPMPSDLGYHSYKPLFEGQTIITEKCPYLNNQPCYYDGSTLEAEKVFDILCKEGSNGVWNELKSFYKSTFGVKS